MNKSLKILPVFLILFQIFFHQEAIAGNADTYHQGNIAYQEKNYAKAIESYNDLIKAGQLAPELYYNLGNAYFKNGNIPHSILNYERALQMDPKDEDTRFNLKIAALQIVDKIEPVPQIFYIRWLNSITQIMSVTDWAKFSIILLWIGLLLAILYLFGNTVWLRKTGFILSIVFVCLFLFSFVVASKSHTETYVDRSGIILTASVYVKSSPDPKGNDLFIIHEGTKVEVLDELNDWNKIKLQNGNVGWMMKKDVEII